MRVKGFLLVSMSDSNVRFFKSAVKAVRGEIALPMDIDIPDALFYPPKIPVVQVSIDESVIPQIKAINEHCEALQDAGVKIRLVDNRSE